MSIRSLVKNSTVAAITETVSPTSQEATVAQAGLVPTDPSHVAAITASPGPTVTVAPASKEATLAPLHGLEEFEASVIASLTPAQTVSPVTPTGSPLVPSTDAPKASMISSKPKDLSEENKSLSTKLALNEAREETLKEEIQRLKAENSKIATLEADILVKEEEVKKANAEQASAIEWGNKKDRIAKVALADLKSIITVLD